jgi:hypothetical protein
MARSVTFNGITRFKPGGITKVNAEALNQVLLSANSIVALVGESEGGAPGATSGLVSLSDPSRATAQYRSGALVDAIRLAFQSSGDPDILAGASEVLVYKTNNSTQASLSLPSANADNVLGTDAVPGTATGGSTTTLVDTVGLATGTFADDELIGMWVVVRPFTATAEIRQISDYDDASSTVTWVTALNALAAASDEYLILEDEIEVAGVVSSGTTTTLVLDDTDLTLVDDEHNGRWAYIINDDGAGAVGDVFLRRITDTDAGTDTLTITPALPAATGTGAYVQVLPNVLDITSEDWGLHTNGIALDVAEGTTPDLRQVTTEFEGAEEVSPELGGTIFLHLLYRGAAAAQSDTVAATPASTATTVELTTGGLTPSAHVGQQVLVGTEYTTITANTADQLTVSPALSAAPQPAVAVTITTLTAATMEVSGSAGVATSLASTLTGVAGDNLAVTFTAGQTLRQLVNSINTNPNYLATIPPGVNSDTTLVADMDFGPDSEVTILNSFALDRTVGLRQDLKAVGDFYNDFSELVTAVRSTDTGSSVAGCCRPAAWDPAGVLGTTDPFNLLGGTRGTSTNTNFQAGFDALLLVRANSVVPLIDEDLTNEGFGSTATVASVAAQLVDHVATARGTAQNTAGERGGFIGFQGTKTEIINQANAINDFDVQLVAQHPTVLNALGTLEEFGPRILATMGASMRAGVPEVGEPLTFKFLRVSGLTNDNSWDPADTTDSNDFIKAGILFAETIDGKGTRWVRDLTTHVQDDNLAFIEGSVRDVVRFIAFGLREALVDRHTGKKAAPTTITNMRDTAVGFLELARGDNIIVDSTDPTTGSTVRAWHNLKLFSSGDVVTLNVGIFPVPGINFQLNELFLQLPTQSA